MESSAILGFLVACVLLNRCRVEHPARRRTRRVGRRARRGSAVPGAQQPPGGQPADVLTNLANPKVVLFYLAFVPRFITEGGWSTSVRILVLGTVLIVIGLVMDTAIGLAAGTFSTLLLRRPAIQRWLRRAAAAVFGGLAFRLLLSESH